MKTLKITGPDRIIEAFRDFILLLREAGGHYEMFEDLEYEEVEWKMGEVNNG